MGILNLTPDSFSDGGQFASVEAVVEAARRMVEDGAALLDIGAVSTRPGADPVPVDEEWARLAEALPALREAVQVPLSLDTSSSTVLERALRVGVDLLNDVSALQHDPRLVHVVAEAGLPAVLMHRRGSPQTMQTSPSYKDAPAEVLEQLKRSVDGAVSAGIPMDRLLLDPGIGFGKRLEDNLALMANLRLFTSQGHRSVLGCSRKSMLGKLTGQPVQGREHATTATTILASQAGIDFVRVHDCRAASDALAVAHAVSVASECGRG